MSLFLQGESTGKLYDTWEIQVLRDLPVHFTAIISTTSFYICKNSWKKEQLVKFFSKVTWPGGLIVAINKFVGMIA